MRVPRPFSAPTALMGVAANAPFSRRFKSAPQTNLQPSSTDVASAPSSGRRTEIYFYACFKHLSAL